MSKPPAIAQGSIARIWKLFIAPLVRYKHRDQSLDNFLNRLFHSDERPIVRYVVKQKFKMPGLLALAPTVKIQGIGNRDVPVGATLWVRTEPTEMTVEWHGGPGRREQIFSLDTTQWGWVKLRCDEAEDRREGTKIRRPRRSK